MNSNFSPLDYDLNCEYRNRKENRAAKIRQQRSVTKTESGTSIMQAITNLFTNKKEEKKNAPSQPVQQLLPAKNNA